MQQQAQSSRDQTGHDASAEPGQQLDRQLGLRQLVVYGLISVVPIAPMAVYGFVAHESFGMVPLVYAVGVVAMLFTALSYKQLSSAFPFAGSVYTYVHRGLHPYAGFVAGWMILADYLLVPALIYALSASWMTDLVPGVPGWVWILVFVSINTAVNLLGIKLQTRFHLVLLAIEVLALLVFLVFAIHFVFVAGHGTGGWSIAPFWQPQHFDLSFIATAASIAVLSFLGFDAISTMAEETKNPRVTVGNATLIVLLLVGVIFIFQTYMAALAHPDYANLDPELGFFQIAGEVGGQWLYLALVIMHVGAVGIANALAVQAAVSRILFSMGRDRVLPGGRFLSRLSPRKHLPVNAIVLVSVLSVILALIFSGQALIKLVSFGALTAFMLLNVTVFVYFFIKQKRRKQFFRYLIFPAIGLAIVAFVWSGFDRTTLLLGGTWLVAGLIFGAFRYRRATPFEGL